MKMTKPQNDILSGDWMLIWIHFKDWSFMSGIMANFWRAFKGENVYISNIKKYQGAILVSLKPGLSWTIREIVATHYSWHCMTLYVMVKIAAKKKKNSKCGMPRATDKFKCQICHYFHMSENLERQGVLSLQSFIYWRKKEKLKYMDVKPLFNL